MAKPALDIEAMSRDERLDLLQDLWESLRHEVDGPPLTDEQQTELDRRLDALDRDGAVGISPAQLRARLRLSRLRAPSSTARKRSPTSTKRTLGMSESDLGWEPSS